MTLVIQHLIATLLSAMWHLDSVSEQGMGVMASAGLQLQTDKVNKKKINLY